MRIQGVAETNVTTTTHSEASGTFGSHTVSQADTTVAGQYTTVNLMAVPILEFARNELYASVDGLTLWDVGATCCTAVNVVAESIVRDFHIWHVSRYGYYGYGQNYVTFDGWVQRGDKMTEQLFSREKDQWLELGQVKLETDSGKK